MSKRITNKQHMWIMPGWRCGHWTPNWWCLVECNPLNAAAAFSGREIYWTLSSEILLEVLSGLQICVKWCSEESCLQKAEGGVQWIFDIPTRKAAFAIEKKFGFLPIFSLFLIEFMISFKTIFVCYASMPSAGSLYLWLGLHALGMVFLPLA